MKKSILLLLGLAAILAMVAPSRANAAVVVGVAVGRPVYFQPAYPYRCLGPHPYYYGACVSGYVYPHRYWGPYWRQRRYPYRVYAAPRPW